MNGSQFRAIRESMGLTSVQFAEALGYGGNPKNMRQTIHRYEIGESVPPIVARLAWLLGEIHANREIKLSRGRVPRWPADLHNPLEGDPS